MGADQKSRRVSHRNGTGRSVESSRIAHGDLQSQITGFADRNRSRSLSADCSNQQAFRSWSMTTTNTPISALLEEALQEPSIGETTNFRWHATAIGIAALWRADTSPSTPPFETALKEGLEIGLDLSREEKEFHQVNKGLILLFHS